MSGLLRRLTRRRPATADETGSATPESSEPAGAPANTPAESGGESPLSAPADEQATQVLPATGEQPAAADPRAQTAGDPPAADQRAADQPAADQQPTVVGPQPTAAIQQPPPQRDLPAGVDPNELAAAPIASARRGKLRRRLRYLRAVRDLLLRDLGGFTYEVERSAGGRPQETHRRLIEAKTNRIAALDTEVRGLESRLGEPHGGALLREPGIGGTCPECGEIHASDAHYCARCGAPLDAKARARRDAAVAAAGHQTTGSHTATPEPAPASVLWAAGPRPEHKPGSEDDEPTHPSLATSQWLALRPHGAAEKGEAPAAKGDEPEAKTDEPVATSEPAAKTDEPVATSEPAAKTDEPAATPHAPAKTDQPGSDVPLSERTATWLGAAKPTDDAEKDDAPAPQTVAAKRAGTRRRATGTSADQSAAAAAPADETAKPKRPRATRARKAAAPAPTDDAPAASDDAPAASDETPTASDDVPAASGEVPAASDDAPAASDDVPTASDEAAATSGEAAPAKPKRTRAKKPAPEFSPEPNGRRDDPVSPPHGDALTSRPEQGS